MRESVWFYERNSVDSLLHPESRHLLGDSSIFSLLLNTNCCDILVHVFLCQQMSLSTHLSLCTRQVNRTLNTVSNLIYAKQDGWLRGVTCTEQRHNAALTR